MVLNDMVNLFSHGSFLYLNFVSAIALTTESHSVSQYSYSIREVYPTQHFLHCSLYILVPQTIDERIEHGGHHSIEEGDEGLKDVLIICTNRTFGLGLCIHEENGSIEYNYHCQVG